MKFNQAIENSESGIVYLFAASIGESAYVGFPKNRTV
jgi:hypothetical protein